MKTKNDVFFMTNFYNECNKKSTINFIIENKLIDVYKYLSKFYDNFNAQIKSFIDFKNFIKKINQTINDVDYRHDDNVFKLHKNIIEYNLYNLIFNCIVNIEIKQIFKNNNFYCLNNHCTKITSIQFLCNCMFQYDIYYHAHIRQINYTYNDTCTINYHYICDNDIDIKFILTTMKKYKKLFNENKIELIDDCIFIKNHKIFDNMTFYYHKNLNDYNEFMSMLLLIIQSIK
jgi:hypothetical protein